jgi:hypothetical protein
MKGNPRRTLLWIFGTLVVLCPLTICGGGCLAIRSLFAGPANSLPQEIILARKAGMPLEPNDLRPKVPIPRDENAAVLYKIHFPPVERIFNETKGLSNACRNLIKGQPAMNETQAVAKALTDAREPLAEIVAASKRPECDFEYRYEQGFSILFPEFSTSRNVAMLLCAEAHEMADQGHVSEAYDLIASTVKLGRDIGKTPTVIAMLIELAIESIAMDEFNDLIQRSSRSDVLLAKARHTLAGFGPLGNLRTAFGGEVVMGLVSLKEIKSVGDLRSMTDMEPSDHHDSGPSLPEIVRLGFQSRFLHSWRQVFEALPVDPADWQGASTALKKVDHGIQRDSSLSNTLNRIFFPVFDQAADAIGHQQANRNLAITSIQLFQDHLRIGKFPSTLPSYGPTSLDPFDGKSLRYTSSGSGFTIYSIDRDRVDNGGRKRNKEQTGDLVRTFR